MIRIILWCKPKAKYFLAVWIVTIIVLSSVPSLPTLKVHTTKIDIRLDYLIHICEYGLLAFMAFLAFTGRDFKMSQRKYILVSVCLILFSLVDEFHQKFIPGRTYNVNDIISNVLGILAALIFCIVIFRKISKNRS